MPINYQPKFGHLFDRVSFEARAATIKDESGAVVATRPVVAPRDWSQLAVDIVGTKYLYGKPGVPGAEESVSQLVNRVVRTIATSAQDQGHVSIAGHLQSDLFDLCLNQHAAFNSPVWFNVGVTQERSSGWCYDFEADAIRRVRDGEHRPQGSACFIQSVDDSMESILDLAKSEGMLFKYGSGTGTDLSTLRSTREKLSGGGTPSGPVSFMRIYDQVAAVIKSGGRSRRAAKMQTLKVTHPDIVAFIECKPHEDAKARKLIEAGYDGGFNGEAYDSVFYQNANLSVRATDAFMEQARDHREAPWVTQGPTGERFTLAETPTQILDKIAEGTWACGDPGMQFEDTIQRWHTCPNTAPINSSNPCSEYLFIDNSSCNLASINLMKFRRDDGSFDVDAFQAAVRALIIAMDALVDLCAYPTEAIARNSHDFRPLGLGYTNLGAYLMSNGIPYDSEEGRAIAAAITALMHFTAYRTSAELAKELGPFAGFAANREPMLRVVEQHKAALDELGYGLRSDIHRIVQPIRHAADQSAVDALAMGRQYGYRNSQVTVLAPTGTISFLMDADTTGIEPAMGLIQYKTLSGGGVIQITNRIVPMALERLGYDADQIEQVKQRVRDGQPIGDIVAPEHLPIFDCAHTNADGRAISWRGHVAMMAAVQPFLSGAISKTVNMPREATVADIREAYVHAWASGLKAIAIYRDGSKGIQPVTTRKDDEPVEGVVTGDGSGEALPEIDQDEVAYAVDRVADPLRAIAPVRKTPPRERPSTTVKFQVGDFKGYLTVGYDPDTGDVIEFFVSSRSEPLGTALSLACTLASKSLQYGVPLEEVLETFAAWEVDPRGATFGDPDVPFCRSIYDFIARKIRAVQGRLRLDRPFTPETNRVEPTEDPQPTYTWETPDSLVTIATVRTPGRPICPRCTSPRYVETPCELCPDCGLSGGCG